MERNIVLKPLVWIACLSPFARIIIGVSQGTLGANPVEQITHRTGLTALILLLITLANSPLRRWTRLAWLIQYRRLFGLFAFFYASLHLAAYVWLDQNLSFSSMSHDVFKRPYVVLGAFAWLLLLPLVLTSTRKSMRTLGRNWARVHSLIYVAVCAASVHFVWLAKDDRGEALFYMALLAVLLGLRMAFAPAKAAKQEKALTAQSMNLR